MPIIKPISELQKSNEMQLKINLYTKLAEAESKVNAGETGKPVKKVIQNARKLIHESKQVSSIKSGCLTLQKKI